MSELLRFFKDMRDNGYGLAEIAAQLGTSAIAEPVAGFAAMYDPAHGADAIREGMTYQPRSQAAQEYSQSIGNAAKTAIKPAMPIIDTWKKGVDIAGRYSPVVGAGLRTVPAAIGIAMGAKPALQAGRQVSEGLGAMQGRMIANANAPRTLNAGYMGQRGTFAGINALTADKEALAKAQQMIAQGVDPAQVWKETGWGKGVDGKWRFEINDKFDITDDGKTIGSSLDYNNGALPALAYGNIGVARGQQILNHNDLYDAYPDLKMMEIRAARDVLGDFDNNNQIRLNHSLLSNAVGGRDLGDTVNAHSILMHELQHKIQQTENFAKGGNPDQFKELLPNAESLQDARVMASLLRRGSTVDSVGQDFTNMIGRYPHNGATDLVRNLSPDDIYKMTADPKEAYRRLSGEVEARTTQSRLNLDPQQRRENYPFDYKAYGYDVPAKSQTVDFGNNKANAQRPLTEFEQAHLTAQRNAALPVEKGGLGLAADNTAGFRGQRGAIGTLSTDDDLRALARFNQMDDVYKFDNSHEYYDPIDKLVARNLSDDSFDFMELPTSYGKMSITPSAKEQGKWQVTQWAKDGNPLSDSGNLTKEKALRVFFEDSRPELLSPPKKPLTEFEQAHLTAQRNAALPVEKGGLGLPADNTAMDRARAMGFDVDNPVYHGTGADIEAFDPKLLKETSQYMKGVFTTDKPDIASNYGDTVYPLVQKQGYTLKDKRTDRASGKTPKEVDTIRDKDKNIIVTTKPENIRSRFAAFDPFNRDSSNLLATTAPLVPTTALGAYMYNEKRKKSQGNQ